MSKEASFREKAIRDRQRLQKVMSNEELAMAEISSTREEKQTGERKLDYPLIRLLAAFFIMVPIVALSVYYLVPMLAEQSSTSAGSEEFETVGISNNNGSSQNAAAVADEEEEKAKEAEATKQKEQEEADRKKKEAEEKAQQEAKEKEKAEAEEKAKKEAEKKAKEEAEKKEKELADKKAKEEEKQQAGKVVQHTVQPQETMYRIAMNYYQSTDGIAKIKAANHLSSEEIYVGQVLQIPLD